MKAKRRVAPITDTIKVIIVDDHPVVRRGIAGMINQEQDMEVCAEAEGFNEALDELKTCEPDIAVVDLTLKDIGGMELVKQLKESYPDLPALVLFHA